MVDSTLPAAYRGWRLVLVPFAMTVLVVLAYLCFQLGRDQAGYAELEYRREIRALGAQLAETRAANEELRRQVAIHETSRDIDRETYKQVEKDLGELQARIQAQEEELVFYRGIVSPQDGVAGLRLQNFEVIPSDGERRYLLRMVLVQGIVHSRRAAGVVKLRVAGTQAGKSVAIDLDDLVPEDSPDRDARGRFELAYAFRYFQALEAELELPVGFEPEKIDVEIRPAEPRGERSSQSLDWSAVGGD